LGLLLADTSLPAFMAEALVPLEVNRVEMKSRRCLHLELKLQPLSRKFQGSIHQAPTLNLEVVWDLDSKHLEDPVLVRQALTVMRRKMRTKMMLKSQHLQVGPLCTDGSESGAFIPDNVADIHMQEGAMFQVLKVVQRRTNLQKALQLCRLPL